MHQRRSIRTILTRSLYPPLFLPLVVWAVATPHAAQQTPAATPAPQAAAAPAPPPPIVSPEVSAEHRVTFRFRAPNAKDVFLAREGAQRVAMTKDESGVWSVTTDALEPDMYGYSFVADGVSLIDP